MFVKKIALSSLALFAFHTAQADVSATSSSQDQARAQAMLLGKTLKGVLQSTMKAEGPLAAIEVCNVQAMPLTAEISAKTDWTVARTSLKIRNPANQADAWETEQLKKFDQRLAAGASPASLEVLEVQTINGQQVERFMKAIPAEQGCLGCHGEPQGEVAARLSKLYPNDQAKGYQAGELRGAFTLQRIIK